LSLPTTTRSCAKAQRILDGAADIDIVGEATNGFEVLSHVRQGGFDLLMLDLSMPGRSGVDLIRQVRSEAPKLAILILTMHEEEQYAVRAIRAGAQGYLTKGAAPTVGRSARSPGRPTSAPRWPSSWRSIS
jgi:DNA-binding NarL/FixJ family response regulator